MSLLKSTSVIQICYRCRKVIVFYVFYLHVIKMPGLSYTSWCGSFFIKIVNKRVVGLPRICKWQQTVTVFPKIIKLIILSNTKCCINGNGISLNRNYFIIFYRRSHKVCHIIIRCITLLLISKLRTSIPVLLLYLR